MNPPKSCMSYFQDPLILSSSLICGRARNELTASYGMIVVASEVPADYLKIFLSLINKQLFSVTQLCQVKQDERPKYLMCITPRPDPFLTTSQFLPLSHLITHNRLQDPQLFTRIFSQLLSQTNRLHQHSLVHAALLPSNIFVNVSTKKLLLGPPLIFSKPFLAQFCQRELEAANPAEIRTGLVSRVSWQTDVYQIGYSVFCCLAQQILSFDEFKQIINGGDIQGNIITPALKLVVLQLVQADYKRRPRPGVVLEVFQQNIEIQLCGGSFIEPECLDVDIGQQVERVKQYEADIQEINKKIDKQQIDLKQISYEPFEPVNSKQIQPPVIQNMFEQKTHIKSNTSKNKDKFAALLNEYKKFEQILEKEQRRKLKTAKILENSAYTAQPQQSQPEVQKIQDSTIKPFKTQTQNQLTLEPTKQLRIKSETQKISETASVLKNTCASQLAIKLHRFSYVNKNEVGIKIAVSMNEGQLNGLVQATLTAPKTQGQSVPFEHEIKILGQIPDTKWIDGKLLMVANGEHVVFPLKIRNQEPQGPMWAISSDQRASMQYSVVW
ncbi:Conserved_hypothetical protein [Hexamita inflata]|uniref:Protein kinase domain-containing protein n=1 Tax=Hexamita inflata TaxID=28002 RepID=A0ABP1IZ66_9EUKA